MTKENHRQHIKNIFDKYFLNIYMGSFVGYYHTNYRGKNITYSLIFKSAIKDSYIRHLITVVDPNLDSPHYERLHVLGVKWFRHQEIV